MNFRTTILTILILIASSVILHAVTVGLEYLWTFPPDPYGYAVRKPWWVEAEHIVIPAIPPGSDSDRTVVKIHPWGFSDGQEEIISITLPSTMQVIGDHGLFDLYNLQRINLPEGITRIGKWGMAGLESLEDLVLPQSLQIIDDHAFVLGNITDLIIPDNVHTIGNGAFAQINNLRSVVFGSGLVTLGSTGLFASGAFVANPQLTEVTFTGNNLKTVGYFSFAETGIRNIVIPNSVTLIGGSAFKGCVDLETVILPTSLIEMECEVFSGTSLKSVIMPLSVQYLCCSIFYMSYDVHVYAEATHPQAYWNKEWNVIDNNDYPHILAPVILGYVSGSSKPGNFNAFYRNGTVNISWETPDIVASSVLQGYHLEKRVGGGPWFTLSHPAIGNTYHIDPHVTIGMNYEYRLSARYTNPDYEAHPTEIIEVIPYILNTVQNFTYGLEGRTVVLNWTTPNDLPAEPIFQGYRVFRTTNAVTTEVTTTAISGYTFRTETEPAGVHTYSIRAVSEYNQSEPEFTTLMYVGFDPPTDMTAIAGIELVNVSWTAPNLYGPTDVEIVGYRLERRVGTAQWATRIDLADNIDTFIDTEVTVGTSYEYRIITKFANPTRESSPSETSSATPYVVNAPHDVTTVVVGRTVTLNWIAPDDSAGLIGYKVYRNGILITEPHVSELTFEDTNVPSGVHTYTVSAAYPSDESIAIAAAPTFVGFNPPAALSAIEGEYRVNLSWSEPEDLQNVTLSSYRIDRRYANVEEWITIIDELPLSPKTYVDTYNITAWRVYEYRIIANYIEPNHSSIGSNVENAMPFDLPKPNNFVAEARVGVVNLRWDVPTQNPLAPTPSPLTIVGYNIYRDDVFLDTTDDNTFSDRDVSANEYEHTYHVTAVYHHSGLETNLESEASNAQSAVTDVDIVQNIQTKLTGNFPNPFNPQTTIQFEIGNGKSENVVINVYNVRGQHVRTLVNGVYGTGSYSIIWNGTDDYGRNVGSGIYFYRMTTGDYSSVRRMMLLK
jgi:hypothetical protein